MSDTIDMVAALGGELVTYTPYGGVARTFRAIVERRPTQVEQFAGVAYGANTMELLIPKDATNGMETIQPRKDRVQFKKNLADAQETDFTVLTILKEDAGLGDGGAFLVLVQS